MKNQFVTLLSQEMDMLNPDEFVEPNDEFDAQHDHIVGEMTDEMKRLWTLQTALKRQINLLRIEISEMAKSKRAESMSKHYELTRKYEFVGLLFWIVVNDEFKLWGKQSVGIREGYRIVWSDPQPEPPRFMMGGFSFDQE